MIEIKNITKIYNYGLSNEITALSDVSFKINEGELVILRGVSGSGKSTLLSIIAALQKPTFGEVIVKNERISKLPDNFASLFRRENIGFIFQKFNLIPTLSVFDNIVTPLIPENLSDEEIESKAVNVMNEFNIIHKKDELVRNLSGGEQQRVAIARALVNNPCIILADEPTASIDEKLSLQFLEYIKKMKNYGKTIIIATHDPMFFNLPFADKEIIIRNGKVV